jgi:DNA-nicking Smr family endonuclease
MPNKYAQIPNHIVDLHGYTTTEAEQLLHNLLKNSSYHHIRIITGIGANRSGPVLREYVKTFLYARGIRFNPTRREHGGDGALEVFLK